MEVVQSCDIYHHFILNIYAMLNLIFETIPVLYPVEMHEGKREILHRDSVGYHVKYCMEFLCRVGKNMKIPCYSMWNTPWSSME